mmetsp:Transcript_39545/g.82645  ORF Transcript_39545/g.82645 Transcript_39545/m.82645 type:complete len:237 (+) Transcript_39545:104-814(+)
MMRRSNQDDPNSLSKSSNLDWGSLRSLGSSFRRKLSFTFSSSANGDACEAGKGMATAAAAVIASDSGGLNLDSLPPPRSRYDPQSIDRILDMRDMSEDEDSGSDVDFEDLDTVVGSTRKKAKVKSLCMQALIAVAIVCIIVGTVVVLDGTIDVPFARSTNAVQEPEQQRLLEIAEQVVMACDEISLIDDSSACEQLCDENMCCFEEGEYSCVDDEHANCAVYAACGVIFDSDTDVI